MKNPVNFSFVAIMKNERNVLPRLFDSIDLYLKLGASFSILDTGSIDGSVEYARERGAIVHEVGEKFIEIIDLSTIANINTKFVCGKDIPIITENNNRLFNFSAARNYISNLAPTDFIITLDCDEAYSKFDVDKIIQYINDGYEQFEYEFVYAHNPDNSPALQFIQSKAYNKKVSEWKNRIHEVLQPITPSRFPKTTYLSEDIIKLEHWQEPGKEHRGKYLAGLALDCYLNPDNDRNSHYFARELMYTGRYESAIQEFKRHVQFNGWSAEKAQSYIYMGDCYGHLNDFENQIFYYNKAFITDSTRREALIKMAYAMRHNKNWHATAAYAAASLQIPYNTYYGNDRSMYENVPYALLYEAQGWIGNKEEGKKSLLKCLEYNPYDQQYLFDTRFFFEYPSSMVDGWMTFEEQTYLYELAKKFNGGKIAEVGSWKGRSSQALLTGNKLGEVYCVDTWQGSTCDFDDTKWMAKKEDIFSQFKENTKQFDNLRIVQKESVEGAKEFPDYYFDAVFIDAGHDYKNVTADIQAWLPKIKKGGILCGHDYMPNTWQEVIEAVNDQLGPPDEIHGTIWVKYLDKNFKQPVPKEESTFDYSSFSLDTVSEEIPKVIYTCWFSENDDMPKDIKDCIESQKLVKGYEHKLITLNTVDTNDPYIKQCIISPHKKEKWVKLKDYIQYKTLYENGGWFLDADVSMINNKNFDKYSDKDFVIGIEGPGTIENSIILGSAVIGCKKGNKILEETMNIMRTKFRGDDNKCYESSLDILTPLCLKYPERICFTEPDVFYPYNHFTEKLSITDESLCIHNFYKSWKLPTLSILIPHIPTDKRNAGLERCIASIKNSNYPQNLIEIKIIEGNETVPEKLIRGVENSKGEYIVYAANDMEFYSDAIRIAIEYSLKEDKALVSFSEGPLTFDQGNICTHFVIRRDFLPNIDGKIFSTELTHVGVDNLLWHKASKYKQAAYCKDAKIVHNHFSKGLSEFDSTYEKGWKSISSDREKLKKLIEM